MFVKMARRRNEIAVVWLEFKDKGQMNRMNVKHVLGALSCAMEGTHRRNEVRFPLLSGDDHYLTGVATPKEAQKEQGHPCV